MPWVSDGRPECRIHHSTTQSIPHNATYDPAHPLDTLDPSTYATVTFNSEDYDPLGMHNPAQPARITFSQPGYWLLASKAILATATDYAQIMGAWNRTGSLTAGCGVKRWGGHDLSSDGVWPIVPGSGYGTCNVAAAGEWVELRLTHANDAAAARNLASGATLWALWVCNTGDELAAAFAGLSNAANDWWPGP